jgi:hypothetical protein
VDALAGYLFGALVVAALTAWIADRHGRAFWVYLVVTVLFPIVALFAIPYLLLFTRTVPPEERSTRAQQPAPIDDRVGQLERLANLRDSGALTPDEYEAEKARILQR